MLQGWRILYRFRWCPWVWTDGTELRIHGVIACRRGQFWETSSQTCFIPALRVKSYCATSLWILAECNIAVNIYMPTFLYARRGSRLKPVISWDLFSDGGFSKIISIDFFEGPKTLNSTALKYNVVLNRKSTQTHCCLKVNNINIKFCRKTFKT